MTFARAFSNSFEGIGRVLYICPMKAQAGLAAGGWSRVRGSGLLVNGRWLMGQAGKVYHFASEATAQRWAENAAAVASREAQLIAALPVEKAAAWKAKKREKLAVIAARVVAAAARQEDEAKRAALLAESGHCLNRWADG